MAVPRWGGGRMSCKRRSTKRSFLAPTGSKKQSFTPNGNRVKTANFTLPGPIYGRCHINRQSLEFNLAAQEQSAHPPCDRPLKKLGVERFHPPSSISPQRLQYCGLQGGEQPGVDVFKINANSSILCIENQLPRLPSPAFETLLLLLL